MGIRSITGVIGAVVTSSLAVSVTAVSALLAPGLSYGQQLEEIIVTGTRRENTDLQSTAIAATPVSEAELFQLFAQDVGEIAVYVPGFSAATVTGFNAASFAMRGAAETDIIVYFDPKVGVLVDDFVIPHVQTQLLEPYDIENIEVLRGPQGTLFGKNTTAGAVLVRTIKPRLEETSGDFGLRYASFDDVKARAAFNLPIGDNWAFRLAALYQKSDGYYENGKVDMPVDAFGVAFGDAAAIAGQTVTGDGRNVGGKDVFAGRAKLLWEPSDSFEILGQLEYIQDRPEPLPVINTTPAAAGQLASLFGFSGVESGDPLDQAGIHQSSLVGLDQGSEIDILGAYLNLEWRLGDDHTIYGIVGTRDQESRLRNEYLGTAYESFFSASRDDNRETTQAEFRLASNRDSALNYVVGAFYQTNDVEFCVLQQLGLVEFFGSGIPGILDNQTPLLICNRQDATTFAVYGDLDWRVTDKFSLGFGARFTNEEKDMIAREGLPVGFIFPNGVYNEPLDGQDYSLASFAVATDSETWEEPTYRATASYQFTDTFYSYFLYSHGFKSGGYNDQAGSGGFANFPLEAYQPEFADNFEIGIKWDFADNTARLNATAYYVNYQDFQRSTVVQVPGTAFQETRTFNAADVDASGLDLEFWWQIGDRWSVRANAGFLDTKYNEFLLDRNLDGQLEDFSGRRVVRSPELTAGFDVNYTYDFNGGSSLLVNLNYNHEDENVYYYNDDIGEEFDTILEQRDIINLSATWTSSSDTFYASIFGKNLTDERYQTAAQAVGTLWTFSNYGPPRTYGVDLGYRFGAQQ